MFRSFNRQMITASVALLAAGMASTANADVFIGVSSGGGPVVQEASGTTSANFNGTIGAFTITTSSGTALFAPDYLLSNATILNSGGSGTLTLFVTETNVTQNAAQLFQSAFTSNLVSGGTLLEQTFLDAANQKFATTTPLGSQLFSGVSTSVQTANAGSIPGLFSITEVYTFSASGAGNIQGTIDVSAVPEPATWAMLILGFLGVGFTAYRRKAGFRFS